MATDATESQKPNGDEVAVVPAGSSTPAANAPKGVSEEEQQKLHDEAERLTRELVENPGNTELVESISNIGLHAQRNASGQIDLLKPRVSKMMAEAGDGASIGKDLVALRVQATKINPHDLSATSRVASIFGWIPGVGPSLEKTLQTIKARYEPVSANIDAITASLRNGQEMLLTDNQQLDTLREGVEEAQLSVQRNAYMGELIRQELTRKLETETDPVTRGQLQNVLAAVSQRVMDLRTMEQVNAQLFVSLRMTRDNNHNLSQAVERTVTVTVDLLNVGIAIQMALARQRQVLDVVRETQQFAGRLLEANAASILQHTEALADMYTNPVVPIESVQKAFDDLMAAMDAADDVKRRAIESANEHIPRLTEMSQRMAERTESLQEAPTDKTLEV